MTDKPQCLKCKGVESPHSIEKVDENYWKCFECGTIFKPVGPIGRPSLGVTKKVSVTLREEDWEKIQELIQNGHAASFSDYFRQIHNEHGPR